MSLMKDTEALFTVPDRRYSCAVVIGATVLFFGGLIETSQISQITPLGLMRIGTLPFRLQEGSCLVMGSQLFLGFESISDRICWSRLSVLSSEILNFVILARI